MLTIYDPQGLTARTTIDWGYVLLEVNCPWKKCAHFYEEHIKPRPFTKKDINIDLWLLIWNAMLSQGLGLSWEMSNVANKEF